MADIKFGTDGWRSIIADGFTVKNVQRVSQAAADYWTFKNEPGTNRSVVVGFDRRFMSDLFARCAAEVFAGNGFNVYLVPEPSPTPSVSLATRDLRAAGGVMITASHNPPAFNGYKLKGHHGSPCDPVTCKQVESYIDRNPVRLMAYGQARKSGAIRIRDVRVRHFAALKRLVDFDLIANSGLRFAHEALFGVGAFCFDRILAGTTCKVTTLNGETDPLFGGINPEPVESNYRHSANYLRRHPHDLCLVTDGDADRVGGMDGRGNYLSTHQLICLLLRHLVTHRRGEGKVVKALTTTSMVDKMCACYGLPLVETGVGFKYIAEEMLKGGVLLGAEESGGIGFPGHLPERDGIAAGLMLLEMLAVERRSINRMIADLETQFGPHRYGRIDTHYPPEMRAGLMNSLKANPPARLIRSPLADVKTFDGVKFISRDGSWLMLRGSGTEPVLRIYAESNTNENVRLLLKTGMKLLKRS